MLDDGTPEYVPDRLYERLFQPWTLPESEWPLCREDWARVDAITRLPWWGTLLDFGAGDGTLAAMVCSRNRAVDRVYCVEQDEAQLDKQVVLWGEWPLRQKRPSYLASCEPHDGALCCEVLEHMTQEEGHQVLCDIKRVLKPGAILCVTVPEYRGSRAEYPGHIRKFSIGELSDDLLRAGFKTMDEERITGDIWLMARTYA